MLSDRKFAILVTAVFMCLELVLILNHEMYRDEFQPLLIVRESPSIYEVYQYLHRTWEIHPVLWYTMVYVLNRFTDSPRGMQLLHWCIAGLIVYLFSRYAPFKRWQKILFPFGYMIFYEYAAITRNYANGVLLTFVFCCLFKRRYEKFIIVAFILALLANTNVMGLIIASALLASVMLESISNWGKIRCYLSRKKLIAGMCIIIIGCTVSAIQSFTPYGVFENAGHQLFRSVKPRLIKAIGSVAYGIFPIQIPSVRFWFSNAMNELNPSINVVISLIIIAYTLILLLRKRFLLCAYFLFTVGLISLIYLNWGGLYRNNGYHYIMFIAVLWLLDYESNAKILIPFLNKIHQYFYSVRNKVLCFVLLVQLFCSITPVAVDLLYPFSAGLQAASWIEDSGREGWLIAGHYNFAITPVVGYLKKKLYSLEFDTMWINPCQYSLTEYEERTPVPILFSKLPRLRDAYGKEILFVFNFPVEKKLLDTYQLVELARFDNAVLEGEQFYIYVFRDAQ